jgi:cysteine-rich repeat protein
MGHQFHVNNGIDTPGECSPSAEPGCGDGVLDSGEACDNGEQNSDTAPDACRTDCTSPSCGDGVVDTGEQCDDGGTDPGDGCDASCRTESPPLLDCGNLVLEGDEQCECQDKTQGCSIEIAEVNEEFEACRGAATCTLCECQESLAGSESNLTAPAAGGCSLIRHR